MLSVLLMILKVLAIIILSLLCLVIFLLCLILFVPIKYNIYGDYHEKLDVKIRVSWFLRLISFKAEYNDEFKYRLRILVFNILKSDSPSKDAIKKTTTKKEKNVFDDDLEDDFEEKEDKEDDFLTANSEGIEDIKDDENLEDISEQINQADKENVESKDKQNDSKKNTKKAIKKESLFEKIRRAYRNLRDKIGKLLKGIKKTYNDIKTKKEDISSKINKVKDMIEDEENKAFVHFIFLRVKEVFRAIKPRKYSIKLHIGFEDPATTGQVLMFIAPFCGLTGLLMDIDAEFDRDVKEADIKLKGHVRLISILVIAIKLLLNKKFRELVFK